MASLMKVSRFFNSLPSQNKGCFYNVVRNKVLTHDDWAPGPYPKTEEERKKAAEKYGLHPDEYQPYPDDGWGVGDYPMLPDRGRATRDPYYPWDDQTLRRNYGEPYHRYAQFYGEDRIDGPLQFSGSTMWGWFLGACTIITGAIFFCDFLNMHHYHPVMEKQYPQPGVVHYTFEPAH